MHRDEVAQGKEGKEDHRREEDDSCSRHYHECHNEASGIGITAEREQRSAEALDELRTDNAVRQRGSGESETCSKSL